MYQQLWCVFFLIQCNCFSRKSYQEKSANSRVISFKGHEDMYVDCFDSWHLNASKHSFPNVKYFRCYYGSCWKHFQAFSKHMYLHVCVSNYPDIGPDSGLTSVRHQAITWTNYHISYHCIVRLCFNVVSIIQANGLSFDPMRLLKSMVTICQWGP